jgi:hypothetical protein
MRGDLEAMVETGIDIHPLEGKCIDLQDFFG